MRRPGKLPVIFHTSGKEITLHLQLTDSVFKIKELLAAKGYTVTSLMLGSARIDDNATVEKAKLIPFSSVYCKSPLSKHSVWTHFPSFMTIRHIVPSLDVICRSRRNVLAGLSREKHTRVVHERCN